MSGRIHTIDATIVDLPTRRPHGFATSVMSRQSVVVVRVLDHDGACGVGEGVTPGGPWWSGESVESIKLMIDTYLAPAVCESGTADPRPAMRAMDRRVARNRFAKAAVEMALWDLLGRRCGLSLAELLGGRAHGSLPITWAVSAEDRPETSAEALAKVADGFPGIKFKMGALPPRQDVARVAALRERLPVGTLTVVDPNGAWDGHTAARSADTLARAGIDIIEQPVPEWDRAAMTRLRREQAVRVMADESVQSPQDVAAVVRADAADSVSLKLPKAGGVANSVAMAEIARAAGVGLYGGSTLETSIGAAASAQVYSTWPDLIGCELVGPLLLVDDLVARPLEYRDGKLTVPTGPGLGVELDDDVVAFHARR